MSNKKNIHKAEQDKLLVLKLYLYFSELGPNSIKTLAEIETDQENIPKGRDYSKDQLRKALNHLEEGGFIKKDLDAQRNNIATYRLISVEGTEGIDEQKLYEFTVHELIKTYTELVDGLDLSSLLTSYISHKSSELSPFLTVSTEDEFYRFDKTNFQNINLIFQNHASGCYTKIVLDKNKPAKNYYVFQIRLWNDGFNLACLEPKNEGASFRYYNLEDVLNIQQGKTIDVNNKQLKDVTDKIIGLSNNQIKELARLTK
ncbi:MAG: hypothetical protein WC967_11510 [Balneolaceae bacterium]